MGTDKALVVLGGNTLLEHVVSRFAPQVASLALNGPQERPNPWGLPLLADNPAVGAGPLAGVLAALRHTRVQHPGASHVATVPVDCPFLPENLVHRLRDGIVRPNTIAVARSAGGTHPVFGLWPLAVENPLEAWLRSGGSLRVGDFLAAQQVESIPFAAIDTPDGNLDPFFNINSPADLETAARWLTVLDPAGVEPARRAAGPRGTTPRES